MFFFPDLILPFLINWIKKIFDKIRRIFFWFFVFYNYWKMVYFSVFCFLIKSYNLLYFKSEFLLRSPLKTFTDQNTVTSFKVFLCLILVLNLKGISMKYSKESAYNSKSFILIDQNWGNIMRFLSFTKILSQCTINNIKSKCIWDRYSQLFQILQKLSISSTSSGLDFKSS